MIAPLRAHLRSHDDIAAFDWSKPHPVSIEAFHGTTHEFDVFDISKHASNDGAFGKLHYFTDNLHDAVAHYAGVGPDLQSRISDRVEHVFEEIKASDPFDDQDEMTEGEWNNALEARADEIARTELVGPVSRVMTCRLDLDHPFVINGQAQSATKCSATVSPLVFPDYEADLQAAEDDALADLGLTRADLENDLLSSRQEDAIFEARNAVADRHLDKLLAALTKACEDVDPFGPVELPEDIIYEIESLTHDQLYRTLKRHDAIIYASDRDDGRNVAEEVISRTIEALGYDGLILLSAELRFCGMQMMKETAHIHVFDSAKHKICILDHGLDHGLDQQLAA